MLKKAILLTAAAAAIGSPLSSYAAAGSSASSSSVQSAALKHASFTDASVVRSSSGTLVIKWSASHDLGAAKVYWSTQPDGGWTELAKTYSRFNGFVAQDPEPGSRVYFMIKGGDGSTVVTAERKLPLKGATNFRDLGGYKTTDGQSVKWGKLFRSDELAGLTEEDKAYLQSAGLKTVVDYRTDSEAEAKPDPTIAGVTNLHIPAFKDTGSGTDLTSLLSSGGLDQLGEPGEMLEDANRQMVQSPEAFKEMFDLLLDPDTAGLVQHCTAGKDRTGFGSALVLLALGVPKETVVDDFMLSNVYREAYNQAALDSVVKQMNLTDEKTIEVFKALMEVRKEYIEAAFNEMEKSYGSIDSFLEKGIGLTKEKRDQLKKLYLN